jgi:hypothetical protein
MNPKIFGRSSSISEDRADTYKGLTLSIPFQGGTCGKMSAEIYFSKEKEDRGGIVLKVMGDDSAAFIPHAKNIDGGIEIHMAGCTEAAVFLDLLKGVLSAYSNEYHQSGQS